MHTNLLLNKIYILTIREEKIHFTAKLVKEKNGISGPYWKKVKFVIQVIAINWLKKRRKII